MSDYKFFIFLGIIIVILIILLGAIHVLEKQNKLDKGDTIFISTRKRVVRYRTTYVWYNRLANFQLTKRYILRMRAQFAILFPGDENCIQEKTVKVSATLWSVGLIAIVVTLVVNPTPYFLACVATIIYVFNVQLTFNLVSHYQGLILKEFDAFLDSVRFYYFKYKMVDEAVYEAMNEAPALMKRHAIKLYEVIVSDDQDDAITKYNKVAPNYFFVVFLASCVTTYNYGDTEDEKGSRFLHSLKNLKQRLGENDIIREDRRMHFAFLPLVSVLPLFSLEAIKKWAISMVAQLESFYEGFIGILLVFMAFVVTIVCFNWINRLKSERVLDLSNHDFLRWLCDLPPIRVFVTNYYNKNYGRKLKIQDLLKKTGSKLTAETFLVKRFLLAGLTIVITISSCFGVRYAMKQRVITSVTGMGSITSASTEEDSVIMMMMTRAYTLKYLNYDIVAEFNDSLEEGVSKAKRFDNRVQDYFVDKLLNDFATKSVELPEDLAFDCAMQYVSSHKTGTTLYLQYLKDYESVPRESTDDLVMQGVLQFDNVKKVATEKGALDNSTLNETVAKDVVDRIITYRNSYFHWYELLLSMCLAVGVFFLPYGILYSRIKDLQTVMDEEVMQFYAVIGILKHAKQMTVEEILEWLMRFSVVFHDSMQTCSNSMFYDEEGALEQLLKDEPYEPFQGIVRNLQMVDSVGVNDAFNQLDVEQINFEEKKKQDDAKREAQNASFASLLGFVPMISISFVYLILPWLVEAFSSMSVELGRINQL